jgi:hypothetical protein
VPATLTQCRCGASRPTGAAALRAAGRRDKLPRDVIALLVVLVLVVIGGLVALFLPYKLNKLPAILGVIDPPPRPPVRASPSPVASPARR